MKPTLWYKSWKTIYQKRRTKGGDWGYPWQRQKEIRSFLYSVTFKRKRVPVIVGSDWRRYWRMGDSTSLNKVWQGRRVRSDVFLERKKKNSLLSNPPPHPTPYPFTGIRGSTRKYPRTSRRRTRENRMGLLESKDSFFHFLLDSYPWFLLTVYSEMWTCIRRSKCLSTRLVRV